LDYPRPYPFPLHSSFKRQFLAAIFVVYLGVVAAITIVPTHLSGFSSAHSNHINIVPIGYSFKCFRQDQGAHPHLTTFCLRNTLGNIALFLPLGILLPLVTNRFRSLLKVMLVALGLSLGIETIQFVLRFVGSLRAVDIDDVLLNTLGAGLGFAIYRYVIRVQSPKSKVQSL
jgi:glycopeptide antibiotics resistance protein